MMNSSNHSPRPATGAPTAAANPRTDASTKRSSLQARRPPTTRGPTCPDEGREHAWEALEPRPSRGVHRFVCRGCGAWGWAPPSKPSLVRAYKEPFVDPRPRRPLPAPEPTVLTAEARAAHDHHEVPACLDPAAGPRDDLPPRKAGMFWYTPKHGLHDWPRVPTRGERRRRNEAARLTPGRLWDLLE